MKTLFIIYTSEGQAIGWARNLIDAIGTKEHIARTHYNNKEELYIKRYNQDDEEYKVIEARIFNK